MNNLNDKWDRHDLWSEYFPQVVAARISSKVPFIENEEKEYNINKMIEWCSKVADKMVEEKMRKLKEVQGYK